MVAGRPQKSIEEKKANKKKYNDKYYFIHKIKILKQQKEHREKVK